jgi:hypothetical protein
MKTYEEKLKVLFPPHIAKIIAEAYEDSHEECIRCGETYHVDELTKDHCECCYDDMFVSWNDVLSTNKTK